MDWTQYCISELVEFNPDNIGKKYPYDVIQYLDISSVGTGVADFSNLIPLSEAPSRAKRIVKKNDSILATVRPGNKSFYYFNDVVDNIVVSTGFAVLRPKGEKIDSRFLYYVISNPSFTSFLVANEQGANYPAVTPGIIGRAEISLPPLPIQKRVAEILSAYDDLIENNLKRIKLLEELAQRTYEEWFVKFRVDGEQLPINESTGLPEGWKKKKLVEVALLTMGQSPKSEFYNSDSKGLPFHQGVSDYGFRFPDNSNWSTEGNRYAEKGDILFSVRAPVGRINVAIEKIILGRGLASIREKNGRTSQLFYQLQNIFFKDDIIGGGAIFNSVTKNDVERIEITVSDDQSSKQFDSFAQTVDRQIENLTIQNRRLKESRDILLPRLMNGSITVTPES